MIRMNDELLVILRKALDDQALTPDEKEKLKDFIKTAERRPLTADDWFDIAKICFDLYELLKDFFP